MADFLSSVRDALSGRYELGRELGRGGMATVFAARDLRHDREVALKLLPPHIAMALGPERFLREIEVTARLSHPHILTLLDSGQAAGLPYYVMPLARGGSLRGRLDLDGPLPVDEALTLVSQVAEALDHAHEQGYVHRDIKPENILLQDDQALVADFGIARVRDAVGAERLTETGISIGTPAYMSPEQAAASTRIDGRSDQYSLACVLYELLAGAPPFTGPTAQAVIARHVLDPVPPIRTIRQRAPRAVDAALVRALAKAPADRFATTRAFAHALRISDDTLPLSPGGGTSPTAGGIRQISRRWMVGALPLVALVGALLWARPWGVAAADESLVGVLPFTTRCTPDFAIWCDGVPDLLGTTLASGGMLRISEPRARGGVAVGPPPDPRAGRTLAKDLGAGRFVMGSVTERGGELQIAAELYRVDDPREPAAQGSVRGPVDEVYRLIDELAAQLLVGEEGGEGGRRLRLAAATTDSLAALKKFLRAETDFRAGRYDSAVVQLQAAVAIDSTFTLGWARLAEAASYTDDPGLMSTAAAQAARGADRLSGRDSVLVAALQVTDVHHAERLLRGLVAADPTDASAWGALGDLLIHGGILRGRSVAEMQQAFATAVSLGDTTVRNVNHLNWAAAMAGDTAAYAAALALALRNSPAGFMAPVHRVELAVLQGDTAGERTALEALGGGLEAWAAAGRLAISGNPLAAERPARKLTDPAEPLTVRALGHELLAAYSVARGKWSLAMDELRAAAVLDPLSAAEYGAFLALVPRMPVGRVTLDSLDRLLDTLRAPAISEDIPWMFPEAAIHPSLRLYLRGLLAARAGRWRVADSLAGALRDPSDLPLVSAMVTGVRASSEAAQAHYGDALALLERQDPVVDAIRIYGSPFYGQVYERYLRGSLLARQGRQAEALAWLSTIHDVSLVDIAYLAPADLERAELLERLGRRGEAADAYRRFIRAWSQADPQLQPAVREARVRLAGLERS